MKSTRTLFLSLLLVTGGAAWAQPTITSVVDPYTGGTKLSPGGQAVITGTNLGVNPQVTVGGMNGFNLVPPQLGTQITFVIPVNAPVGSTIPVVVTTGAGASAPFNITVAQYAPVLVNTTSGALTSPRHQSSGVAVAASTPAAAGENVVVYAIGMGPVNTPVATGQLAPQGSPDNTTTTPTVTLNGTSVAGASAQLAAGQGFFGANYSGPMTGSAQALIGIYQVIFTVPSGTAAGSYPLTVSIGGATSNIVMLSVGPAPAGPVISAIVGETGKTTLCPGDIAIVSGLNFGQTPTVKFAGKAAFIVNPPNGGNQMTVEIPVDTPLITNNFTVTTGSGTSPAFPITMSQYAPALLYGGNGNPTLPLHASQPGAPPVTTTYPAAPGETIGVLVYGLGATNPVVPTGTPSPSNTNVTTVTAPTVNVGGQTVPGTAALAPNQIGVYVVTFAVPLNQPNGGAPVWVSIGGLSTGIVTVQVFNGPIITNVANAASNLMAGLPNAGIAQGSIFIAQGSGLGPAGISIASSPFQTTLLSGTSVAVTVNGTTVNAPMYYTLAGQVAALLPSNTPTGTGTITVTYNGTAGPAAPISVVANNLGIFTVDSTGQGPAIVTYTDYSLVSAAKAPNCGGPNTTCGSANPGDVLILWATGLGPVTGGDTASTAIGQPISTPLTVWLGGVQAPVVAQGRGCCFGEDQIAFTVPNNAPTGCAVPLVVQMGTEVSNSTVMPVAVGSRNCTPLNPALAAVNFEQEVTAGPVRFGSIKLRHPSTGTNTYADDARFQFFKILAYDPRTLPFLISWLDDLPMGTCLVVPNLSGSANSPIADSSLAPLSAGSNFTIKGPNGSVQVNVGPGQSDPTLSAGGTFLVPGPFTVSGTGGADVGPINASVTFPGLPALTSPASGGAATRSSGLTATWTGSGGSAVQLLTGAPTDATLSNGAIAECVAPAGPGTFTIPPYVMQAIPAGSFAGFAFEPGQVSAPFTATGLDFGLIQTQSDGVGFGFGSASGSFTLK